MGVSSREEDGGFTLGAFLVGLLVIGLFGKWWIALAVGLLGFAFVGELQRKANQVIDALEDRRKRGD